MPEKLLSLICCNYSTNITVIYTFTIKLYLTKLFLFGSSGVFGVDADEVSVSVMVGDSVTLNTDVTDVPNDTKIIWKVW